MKSKIENIKNYYLEVCKKEKLNPIPIKFCSVSKGGACLQYSNSMKPLNIQIDLNRCVDIEYALLHEISHQILLEKKKDPALRHNAAFRKIENQMNDKYMYSDLTFKYRL
ncbi:hypothetical protein [Lutibacter sp.]|uniref:hypothetical protein n=1 Tax=Lutibacter sp. TaxID=1925666 RepID=UPI0034A07C59